MARRSAWAAVRASAWLRALFTVVQGLLILLVVSIAVFLATQAMPGDTARVLLGNTATPARVALLQQQLGLNKPLVSQYLSWLSKIVRGDFGTSLASGQPVATELVARLENSAYIAAVAVVIIIPVSVLVGVLSARFRDGWFDRGFLTASMVANALPDFVVGTLLVAVFGTNVFHWFPPVSLIPIGARPWWYPSLLVLPVTTLVIGGVMYLGRLIRASVIDVLGSEYVEMAELKGLSGRRILLRHALPNAIAPTIPATSLVAAYTVGGVVVVEYLFNYPGVGALLIQAIDTRDIPVIQAVVMVIAAAYFVFNRIADLIKVGKY